MSYVDEVSDLVLLHARAQGITPKECREVLDAVTHTGDDDAGSWSAAWIAAADEHMNSGRPLDACRRYNLARFPYPETFGQRAAVTKCVEAFDQWRSTQQGIERRDLRLRGRDVPVWASGLNTTARKPLLVVMGGIVSIKEQWAQFLLTARRLGMAVIVTEMPGVGENPLRYEPDSWLMLADLADAAGEITPITDVYVVAPSFGGTLAIRWAASDPRVRGIATVGAPVSEFFTDSSWWAQVPQTTKRTLVHLTGRVGLLGSDFALSREHLAEVTIPVHYVISKRDEIVPAGEAASLSANLPLFASREFDDVHGSPAHLTDTKLWIAQSVLDWRNGPRLPRAAMGAMLNLRGLLRRAS